MKRASEGGIDAKDFEKIGADIRRRQPFRLALAGQVDAAAGKYGQRFKRAILLAVGGEIGLRQSPGRKAQIRTGLNQSYQAVRLVVRQRAKENAVHQTENRCVRTDAERQRHHRDQRKTGIQPQHAQPIT